tara:strand:+ start:2253 stop:2807 length:555 start_codon:yes stop_codon:yes gene_type:complete
MNDINYETRLLYRQKHTIETDIALNVIMSAIHAVSYRYPQSLASTTSRIRTTLIYTEVNGQVVPEQGLLEQFKQDGWVPIDEFLEEDVSFNTYDEYEEYAMLMVKSFLIGVPIEATGAIAGPAPATPKMSSRSKQFKAKLIPKTSKTKEDSTKLDNTENEEVTATSTTIKDPVVETDSDDDDWL